MRVSPSDSDKFHNRTALENAQSGKCGAVVTADGGTKLKMMRDGLPLQCQCQLPETNKMNSRGQVLGRSRNNFFNNSRPVLSDRPA